MNIKNALKNFISIGAILYTAISVLFISIAACLSNDTTITLIHTDRFLNILLFSYIMSLGSTVIRIPEVSHVVGVCTHAACYIGGCFIFLISCNLQFSGTVIMTVVFAILYTVISLAVSFIKKKLNKKNNSSAQNAEKSKEKVQKAKKDKNKSYTNQFSK